MPEIAIQTAGGTKERFPIARPRVTIGRSRESDIFLPDQWLSRNHAEIEERADGFYVHDLSSKNGTLLNGEPLHEWRLLRPGDIILVRRLEGKLANEQFRTRAPAEVVAKEEERLATAGSRLRGLEESLGEVS